MNITSLGESRFSSSVLHTVSDRTRIPATIIRDPDAPAGDEVLFELAGPRAKHIPIEMLALEKKHIDPDSLWWKAVLAATGQPARFQ